MIEYNPFAPEAKQSPHDFFAQLRQECPVHHHILDDVDVDRINANPLVAHPTSEFWSVFRYADCTAILQDPARFSNRQGPGPERLEPMNEEGMLLFADDPAHMRQRRIANKAFTPRMIEQLRPRIQKLTDELIDKIAGEGEAELMSEFSVPLTVSMIAAIMGVGPEHVDDLRRWGNDTIGAFGGDAEAIEKSFVSMTELFAFLQARIAERRALLVQHQEPPPDVLTSLIMADYDGAHFTDTEIMMACQQLLVAGYETTSTAIGTAVFLLCTHPSERKKLENDPTLLDNVIEEVLRYDAPIEGTFRTTTESIEIDGTTIPRGAKVRVVFASANRDDREFSNAGEFRVDRDPAQVRRHVAFGLGPHTCLGASLARAELGTALATLLERLPELELDPERTPVRNPNLLVNGFRTLPVRWDAAGSKRAASHEA